MMGASQHNSMLGTMLPGYEDRLISTESNAQYQASSNVFVFGSVDSWKGRMWSIMEDYLSAKVRAVFMKRKLSFFPSDDLTWLDDIIEEATGHYVGIKSLTAERIMENFAFFRAFHGTRTADLASFYENGIRALRPSEIEDRARGLFLNGQFKWATEDKLRAAIQDVEPDTPGGCRSGYVYFAADDNELIDFCGHYLLYGSEYLYCLAVRLVGPFEAQRVLKSIGRPTMFVCDIPIELISRGQLECFAGDVLQIMFCDLRKKLTPTALQHGSGSSVFFRSDLPATSVVGHYHPVVQRDPFNLR